MSARGPAWGPLVLGFLLALIGLGWIGQGIGLLPGSFMSGSGVWAVVGLLAVVVGGILVARWARLRRRG